MSNLIDFLLAEKTIKEVENDAKEFDIRSQRSEKDSETVYLGEYTLSSKCDAEREFNGPEERRFVLLKGCIEDILRLSSDHYNVSEKVQCGCRKGKLPSPSEIIDSLLLEGKIIEVSIDSKEIMMVLFSVLRNYREEIIDFKREVDITEIRNKIKNRDERFMRFFKGQRQVLYPEFLKNETIKKFLKEGLVIEVLYWSKTIDYMIKYTREGGEVLVDLCNKKKSPMSVIFGGIRERVLPEGLKKERYFTLTELGKKIAMA